MFQTPHFHEAAPSQQLQLLPTMENLLLRELKQIQMQSQLMQRLAKGQKSSLICDSTIEWESERESEQDSFQICRGSDEGEEPFSKISLLLDCRLRRMRQDEDILAEIESKCSKLCADRVKTVFSLNKQHSATVKQLQNELSNSTRVNDSLLPFKEENLSLKQRLATAELKLAQFAEVNSKNSRFQEKLSAKEKGLLKLEQALMAKEKRLANMRKRIQSLSEATTQRGESVLAAIEQYNRQLSSLAAYESIEEIVRTIQQQAGRVSAVWGEMAALLEGV